VLPLWSGLTGGCSSWSETTRAEAILCGFSCCAAGHALAVTLLLLCLSRRIVLAPLFEENHFPGGVLAGSWPQAWPRSGAGCLSSAILRTEPISASGELSPLSRSRLGNLGMACRTSRAAAELLGIWMCTALIGTGLTFSKSALCWEADPCALCLRPLGAWFNLHRSFQVISGAAPSSPTLRPSPILLT